MRKSILRPPVWRIVFDPLKRRFHAGFETTRGCENVWTSTPARPEKGARLTARDQVPASLRALRGTTDLSLPLRLPRREECSKPPSSSTPSKARLGSSPTTSWTQAQEPLATPPRGSKDLQEQVEVKEGRDGWDERDIAIGGYKGEDIRLNGRANQE